ncbi:hypothetical protein I546_2507 [Mycobacterium kansasii 732]|nr:hypothetical protein I546_2507 [Mycobacterium kansasii 732]
MSLVESTPASEEPLAHIAHRQIAMIATVTGAAGSIDT